MEIGGYVTTIQSRAYDRREAYLKHYVDAFMNNAIGILLSESTQETTPLHR
jgi:hypothetical protein